VKAEALSRSAASGGLLTRGHPLALAAVRRSIERGHAPHAILLIGPRAVGKTTLAMDLAAGLLCTAQDPAARPCRACPACRKVEHGNHPDLHRLQPEGAGEQIRIGQVQSLITDLSLMPMEGRTRVAIIESAHRLNPDAQNALLKTLEEPVGATCIVLCADDPATILPTVASRSARFRLGPVPAADVAALLVDRGLADTSRAASLAVASGGLPGVAVALSRAPDALLIHDRLARQLMDLLAADRRARLDSATSLMADGAALDAALHGETYADGATDEDAPPPPPKRRTAASSTPSASKAPKRPQPAERRRAARRVLTTWREVGRDLAVVAGGARPRIRQLDLLEELDAAAPLVDSHALVTFLDRLDGLVAAIDAYASPELVLDDLLLRWPRTKVGVSPGPRR
jgi:DNA polymerase III subunit delta'